MAERFAHVNRAAAASDPIAAERDDLAHAIEVFAPRPPRAPRQNGLG
jgi:hypothetical protein